MWPKLILDGLLAVVTAVLPKAGDLTTVLVGDKSKRDAAASEADKASQEAFSKEFSYALGAARNRFDAIMDGINRLPRPMMALGAITLPIWTCIYPEKAAPAFTALALIPDALWNIMILIVAFYFSSRMIENLSWGKYVVPKAAEAMAKRVTAQPAKLAEPMPLVSPGSGDLMALSGFGPGQLTSKGYTGSLPPSRGQGWVNPIASQYKVE